ncbi:MAG TPA: hypothetical protein VGA70_09670 [Longimicrobiales bacterium]
MCSTGGSTTARDAPPAIHQESPRATVQVRQVAGSTVYLDLGTRHGLAVRDTLMVLRGSSGPVGCLTVVAASEERSVLTFAGASFPVTRGEALTLRLLRERDEAASTASGRRLGTGATATVGPSTTTGTPTATATPSGPPNSTAAREPSPSPSGQPRQPGPPRLPASGRWSLDLTALHSSTTVGGADPVDVGRTYATPALRLDATFPEAVAGFRLRTSLRLAYRYADPELRTAAGSTRVYHASLERTFGATGGAPVRVALGRFHSPLETYSGYWDGLLVRVGPESLGVGVMVGFEPDRFNETPSTELTKAAAVLDGDVRGPGWRWRFDASAHTVRPEGAAADDTFLGLSQSLSAGRFHAGEDVQVNRDPVSGSWKLTELRLRGSLRLSPAITARAAFLTRRSYARAYVVTEMEDPFGPRGNRVSAGLTLRSGEAFLSGDLSRNTVEDGSRSTGVSGAFGLPGMGPSGRTRVSGTFSHWDGEGGTNTTVAPAVALDRGAGRLRIAYRLGRFSFLGLDRASHGAELSCEGPLGHGYRGSVRLTGQWGGGLRSEGLRVTLARAF